jgi:hypothetical protein
MTQVFVKRTGKLLFPHLPRDQRKNHTVNLMLVLMTSFVTASSLVMWITHGRH